MFTEEINEIREFINNYTDTCVIYESMKNRGYIFSDEKHGKEYWSQALHRGKNKRAFRISIDNGIWQYHDFTEEEVDYPKARTWSYLLEVNNKNINKAIKEFEDITGIDIKKALGTWEEEAEGMRELANYIEQCHSILSLPKNQYIKDYLKSRGETDETIENEKIGYDPNTERIIYPYWEGYNTVVSYVGRLSPYALNKTDREGNPLAKYKKAWTEKYPSAKDRYYNANAFYKYSKANYMCICEGFVDCRSLDACGIPCISYGGGNISATAFDRLCARLKAFNKKPVLVFDNDVSGKNFYVSTAKKLIERGIYDFDCCIVPKFDDIQESEYIDYFTGSDEKEKIEDKEEFKDDRPYKDINDYYKANGNVKRILATRKPALVYLGYYLSKLYKDDFREFFSLFLDIYKHIPESTVSVILTELTESDVFSKDNLETLKRIAFKKPTTTQVVNEIIKEYKSRIMYHRGRGLMFFEKTWKEFEKDDIDRLIAKALGRFDDGRYYDGIIRSLKTRFEPVDVELNAKEIAVFNNGTLYLNEVDENGNFKFMKDYFNPKDYKTTHFNVDYDVNATCPLWNDVVKDLVRIPDNPEDSLRKEMMLQEYLGYIFFPTNKHKKCLFIHGEGNNGKNLLTEMMLSVVADNAVTSITLDELDKNFKLAELKNSILNVSGEDKASLFKVVEVFKTLISGEEQQASVKYKNDIKFKPRAKMIVTTNELLRSSDRSNGVANRLLMMEFLTSFVHKSLEDCNEYEKPIDIDLLDKLQSQKAGFINWILDGYKRLKANGDFTYSNEHKELLSDFVIRSNPLVEFFKGDYVNHTLGELNKNNYKNKIRLYEKGSNKSKLSDFARDAWNQYANPDVENCFLKRYGYRQESVKTFKDNFYTSIEKAFGTDVIKKGRDNQGMFISYTDTERKRLLDQKVTDIKEIQQAWCENR